ncbi:hypothetical protein [Okeania sp. SIO2B3]|uniref:hypothetical protein n=1 Tax=Okeania sp. SIO2B3 TaxID=2607784 RepID=UPI0013C1EBC1|nr:hypothetical protein [Okeania sp. SIO2B3]NET42393.1 hypothetical protein [Okeania sp. SIO2B3]
MKQSTTVFLSILIKSKFKSQKLYKKTPKTFFNSFFSGRSLHVFCITYVVQSGYSCQKDVEWLL